VAAQLYRSYPGRPAAELFPMARGYRQRVGHTDATHVGDHALDSAATIQSARIADAIRDLHQATTDHRGHPDADHLRQRTARALTAS